VSTEGEVAMEPMVAAPGLSGQGAACGNPLW